MARPLRIEFPGAIYHVTSRGNARLTIYKDDQDRQSFLGTLADVIDRHHWLCHAYCLMNNHYHLVVETPDGNLSKGMRQLNGVYTQRFNRRHGTVGHVFQGRFKAILVERDTYLLELCRYVVLNPVRTATVPSAERWRWSSYRATAGLEKPAGFLTIDWVLGQLGRHRFQAQRRYREFVRAGLGRPSPWNDLRGRSMLGGDDFLKEMKPFLQGKMTLREISRAERFADRPALAKVLSAEKFENKKGRDRAIRQAHVSYGYSLIEIARQLGLHYTTISKIVNQNRS
ncbi:MAG: transposase [Deltaproteobacteria bacterium]|nr:transposase [Deltaproteobacteria bacterium]